MILHAVQDWNKNHVLTSVDTVKEPLTNVDFPAIVACHEKPFNHDNWDLTELILNFFQTECESPGNDCNEEGIQQLIQGFESIIMRVMNRFDKIVENTPLEVVGTGLIQTGCHLGQEMSAAILENKTSMVELESRWKTSVFDPSRTLNFDQLVDDFMDGHNLFTLPGSGCGGVDEEVWRFMYKANNWMKLTNLGTFLRNMKEIENLGPTFVDPELFQESWCFKFAYKITNEEWFFHQDIMEKIGKSIGSNVSIFDYPKFLNLDMPRTPEDSPIFTLCRIQAEMIPKFTGELYCGLLWQKNVLSTSRNQQNNPYVTGERPICGSGLVSHTGANFKILLLMMKFVYKLAESKDTEVVYDIVKKAGLPFPMKPLKQVQDQLLNDQHGLSMRYMMDDFTKDKIYNFANIDDDLEVKSHTRPVMTNYGLCYAWNTPLISNVFNSQYVGLFENIFNSKAQPRKKAIIKEYNFILDKHSHDYYPFNWNMDYNYFV